MATLSVLEIYGFARRAGFTRERDEAVIATAIALAESSGNPRSHNATPPDDSFGLWQINMIGDLGPERRRQFGITRNEDLFDPLTNARAARNVFAASNTGFKPWSTFKHRRHEPHLGRARAAEVQFEESGPSFEIDLTEPQVRTLVREELGAVLDHEATKVQGITSWQRYLEVVLEAARRH
jgi:hypothetical protein